MSHAAGEVRDQTGAVLGHFEYNGTVDVCIPAVWSTAAEMQAHWRKDDGPDRCACGATPEPCVLWNDYGSTDQWPGAWCPTCRVIVDGLTEPLDDDHGWR